MVLDCERPNSVSLTKDLSLQLKLKLQLLQIVRSNRRVALYVRQKQNIILLMTYNISKYGTSNANTLFWVG